MLGLFVSYILLCFFTNLVFPVQTGNWRQIDPVGKYLVNTPGKHYHFFKTKKYVYYIDEHGFRGKNYNSLKNNVFFIGDSFTFGYLLDFENTFINLLNTKLKKKYNLINAAVAGSGVAEWMAYAEDRKEIFKNSNLVIMLNYTSFSRGYNHRLFKYDCKNNKIHRNKEIQLKKNVLLSYVDKKVINFTNKFDPSNFFTQPLFFFKKAYFKLREIRNNNKNKKNYVFQDQPYEDKNLDLKKLKCFVDLTMERFIKLGEKINANIIFVDLGFKYQSVIFNNEDRYANYIDPKAFLFFYQYIKKNKISFLNLSEKINKAKANGEILEIQDDGHPNAKANKLISSFFYNNLPKHLKNY